ncbi:acyltransferase family protein [Microbacterium sp. MYb45]|uniref:acyltransferase family protein n=1 Tax=Microbacterium sp. MYb45 TaxID=1827294 RepID=UPI000CFF8763|nr:acyltransferase family protein [Microbacterium sp. MYb45]PRB64783.1 acyltransferase [Microbacterium sp. MYb45]
MTSVETVSRTRREFRTDVQGLRAVAVGLVLLYHAGVPFLTGGYVGVDVFFVISGFLISSHLMESLERDGRIRFADFYARRIRRILPASLVVAVLTAIAAIIFYPPLALEGVLRDALATILYVPNIWFAIQDTDYLADHAASPYQHYWSLGVEEQFYLVWPLILLLLVFLVRRRRALIVGGIAVLAVASLLSGVLLTPIDQPSAFFLLPTRAWELLAGGLVGAVLLRGALRLPGWIEAVGGWVGLAMIVGAALLYDDSTVFPGTAALLPVLGTALVILFGARGRAMGPTGVLSLGPMQFVGLISYSLYLVHWPLLIVTQAAVGDQNPLSLAVKLFVGIVIALPLAWLLFRFIESPLRRPRVLVGRPARVTLWGTLALTLVLVAGTLGAVQWAATRDVGTGDAVAVAPDFPVSPPNGTPFVPRNITPELEAVADDIPPMHRDGCHYDAKREDVQDCHYADLDGTRTIAVFGDSHSAQWFPAVEEFADDEGGIRIDTYTKSSCPAADVTVLDKGVPYTSCDRWRDAVLEALVADPPDLVVISNYANLALAGVADQESRSRAWRDGVERTVGRLRDAGSEVLVIADTPRFAVSPAICASSNVLDVTPCAGERAEVLDADFAAQEHAAAEAAGAVYVDLNDYICTQDSCPVIIDNMLVYFDVNHLTATVVSYLEPALEPTFASLLGIDAGTDP